MDNRVRNQGENKRESFASSFGLLAAAIGSAVGLGNIWRFPYITGVYGGGAFLVVYLLCVAIIGIPVMIAEFIIGREGQKDAIGSYKTLAPKGKWHISGILGVGAAFLILSFYSVVAGWTLEYIFSAIGNKFAGLSAGEVGDYFVGFISDPIRPIFWQVIFMAITAYIVAAGVQKGIESYSKVLIPLLLVIIIILDVRSITLSGGAAGLEFLFKPDFSKLTREGVLAALGHAFFSLSLGMGIMITYGSYIPKQEKLGPTSLKISIADTLIALLAGIAIFPAVFAFGIEPGSGAGLVFITLPNVFAQMAGGYLFAIMFFALLALAALTSTISLLEAVVAYVIERFNMERVKATVITALLITLLGVFASLSNGELSGFSILGYNLFDFLDNLTADFFLPISALISSVFVGWVLDKRIVENQLTNNGTLKIGYLNVLTFLFKIVSPIAILIVFISGVIQRWIM
ncbi:sodium-dependent transporter [Clostridium sp. Cult2]|uniref:sodium-dependent transporter n=1 Tax=Clostridium sp. Cult2 TaxID=2079003 RepID=UPI001F3E655E|nr:sodium-dependent transporter [Clostridium sp. Cult2]MCF6466564.1 sodium-dependent transporter [Clostridium sp. Cult2]